MDRELNPADYFLKKKENLMSEVFCYFYGIIVIDSIKYLDTILFGTFVNIL